MEGGWSRCGSGQGAKTAGCVGVSVARVQGGIPQIVIVSGGLGRIGVPTGHLRRHWLEEPERPSVARW